MLQKYSSGLFFEKGKAEVIKKESPGYAAGAKVFDV